MNIFPFKGILYDTKRIRPEDVVTLPYDKISKKQKYLYKSRSPYNMAHLVLPETYDASASLFRSWMKEGVLIRDTKPAVYVYEEEYEYPEGIVRSRTAVIALLKLAPLGRDTLMPHELTFSKVVEDRKKLLSCCGADLEQIFILYDGDEADCSKGVEPYTEFSDESGIRHKLGRITDPGRIREISRVIEKSRLFIADGHHRYKSALLYKEEQKQLLGKRYTGAEWFNYRMAGIVSASSPGLVILPSHRVLMSAPDVSGADLIDGLKKFFIIEKGLPEVSSPDHIIGMYLKGGESYTLSLKKDADLRKVMPPDKPRAWMYLDVNMLHLLVFKHIMGIDTDGMEREGSIIYMRDAKEAVRAAENGGGYAAFILKPSGIDEVREIVSLGEVMPHKSTDFYPKLYSGLVIYAA